MWYVIMLHMMLKACPLWGIENQLRPTAVLVGGDSGLLCLEARLFIEAALRAADVGKLFP